VQTEVITVAIEESIKWANMFQAGGLLVAGIVIGFMVWMNHRKNRLHERDKLTPEPDKIIGSDMKYSRTARSATTHKHVDR
jgi:hypothetical protein